MTMTVQAKICLLLLATAALWSCGKQQVQQAAAHLSGGDPERGRGKILYYGCPSCYTIPGVTGADGLVGPPLKGIVNRVYIAGVLPNNPDNMIRWIQHPRQVDEKPPCRI